MKYTKSEKLNILHETPEEMKLKNYFKSLNIFGEDFACRSLTVRPDIIESMKLFSTEDINSSSDEIIIYMIKAALITSNSSDSINFVRKLMMNNDQLEDNSDSVINSVVDSILVSKSRILELARNIYYQRERNSYESFRVLYKDEDSQDKVLDCITKLNNYLKRKKERKNNQEILLIRKYITQPTQGGEKKTA